MKPTKGRRWWKEIAVFMFVVVCLSVAWLWQSKQVRETEAYIKSLDASESTSAAKAAHIRELRTREAAANK